MRLASLLPDLRDVVGLAGYGLFVWGVHDVAPELTRLAAGAVLLIVVLISVLRRKPS